MSPDDLVAPGQAGMDIVNQAQQQAEQAPDMVQSALRMAQPAAVPSLVPSTPPPGKAASHASLTRLLDRTRRTMVGRMVDRYQQPTAGTAVNRLHGDLRSLAREGEPGRMWYEKSSKRILDYVQGDKDEAHKIAQLIAIYSPQTAVDVNTSNAVKAYNRAKSGQTMWAGDILDRDKSFNTIKEANDHAKELGRLHGAEGSGGSGGHSIVKVPLDDSGKRFLFARHNMDGYENIATADRDLKAHLLMNEGIPFDGRKTNNFYRNLMVHIDPSIEQGSTQDLWMARAFGFHSDEIGNTAKYDFMEKLTDKLGRELGWKPHQVQAAIWTAMKTRQEAVKEAVRAEAAAKGLGTMTQGAKGKAKFTVNEGQEDAYSSLMRERALQAVLDPGHIARSARDFSDFLDKNLAHVSWEATPSRESGHLTGLSDLAPEKRADYHKRISEALQDEQGNDHLAKYLGLLSPGTVEAPGYWQGDVNPASHLQVATTRIKAAGQRPDIDAASKELLNHYADARGLLLKQDGVGYHRPYFDPQVTKANGIEYNFDRELGAGEIGSLGRHIEQIPGSALVPSGPGKMRILHFGIYDKATDSSTPLTDHRKWHKTVDAVLQRAINEPFTARAKLFASDGDLRGNNWKEDPHGENYTRRLSAAGRSDVLQFVSDFLAPKVEAVDQAFAQEHGLKRNQGIERAIRTYGAQENLMGRRFRRADGGAVADDGSQTQWRNVSVSGEGASKAPVEVAVNPTHDEITSLVKGSDRGTARLSKDTEGNVYAWDGNRALHDQVHKALGVRPDRKAMSVIGQMPIARLHQGKLRLTDVMGMSFPGGVTGWHRDKRAARADGGRIRRALGGPVDDDTRKWFADSKVVDPQGAPLVVYRGETASNPDSTTFHSQTPRSISFGNREAANDYAEPNRKDQDYAARVTPAYLRIRNPVLHNPDDPFWDLSDIAHKVGHAEATRVAIEHAEHIQNTDNWRETVNPEGRYRGVADFLKHNPGGLDQLYIPTFPVLNDPKFVRAAVARGYDGAIHGGDGATANDVEYRIFHPRQAKSAISPHLSWKLPRKRADGGPVEDPSQPMVTPPSPSYIKPAPVDDYKRKLSPIGMYSHAAEAAWKQPQMKASPDQFKATLINKHGVKPDEFRWTNYDEAFKGRPMVTKREVRDHFLKNQPKLDERRYSDDDYDYDSDSGAAGEPKYKDYALPGGKNYRELVVHMPKKTDPNVAKLKEAHKAAVGHASHLTLAAQHAEDEVRKLFEAGQTLNTPEGHAIGERYHTARAAAEQARQEASIARQKMETAQQGEVQYQSSHWDEPNVVTHLRLSDRSGEPRTVGRQYGVYNTRSGNWSPAFDSEQEANDYRARFPIQHDVLQVRQRDYPVKRQKILHLEELQSDWGQAGRDEGFKGSDEDMRKADETHKAAYGNLLDVLNKYYGPMAPEKTEAMAQQALLNHGWAKTSPGAPDLQAALDRVAAAHQAREKHKGGLPNAPWVGSTDKWTELGLKRALHEAATGGYDKLVITPGEEQAKRYDLSKQISKITARKTMRKEAPKPYSIDAHDIDGRDMLSDYYSAEELPGVVGREMAAKIIADLEHDDGEGTGVKTYTGLDLQVGGEGMKSFYDRLLPRTLEKLARQHDPAAKVQLHAHPLPTKIAPNNRLSPVQAWEIRKFHGLSDEDWEHVDPQHKKRLIDKYYRSLDTKGHALDITPAMRASILKGQKSFASGGRISERISQRVNDSISDRIYKKVRREIPIFGRYDGSPAT